MLVNSERATFKQVWKVIILNKVRKLILYLGTIEITMDVLC